MRTRLRSLTARLVLTAVSLVLAVSLVVGVVATLAVRGYLAGRLDDDVRGALDRAASAPAEAYVGMLPSPGDLDPDPGEPDRDDRGDSRFGQGVGTLTAYFERFDDYDADPTGTVVDGGRGGADFEQLDDEVLDELAEVPLDGRTHTVRLDGLGTYRVAAEETAYGVVVAGLPTEDVDDVVARMVTWELFLVVLGAGAAALAGLALVRRQLRPLTEVAATAHRVAALPLGSGEIELAERVPDRLTDEATEVGRVGAALNTLLDHVETSLSARHRSEQQVRQFVADASHELRTPLTTIAGYAELARRRPDDAEAQRTALAKVTEESARMTSLVEDLLLLARLDAGRPLERHPVDLTRLLLEAVSDARVLAPDHRWRLDLPEEAVEVVGDELRLHQVVSNLLTNARRHTPPGTTVTVLARPGLVEVRDDGPGFPPELVPHAFDRFVRGDDARTRTGSETSTGLGLALVQAITAAHGGTVDLTSRPGDTRVVVHLPTGPTDA